MYFLIAMLLLFSNNSESEIDLEITFIDEPAYKEYYFQFWKNNSLQVKYSFTNRSQKSLYFEKPTFSGDGGNPKIIIETKSKNKPVSKNHIICIDYDYNFYKSFVILEPGETFTGVIDLETLFDLELSHSIEYVLYFEYESQYSENEPKAMNNIELFRNKIISNKLIFHY
jgi:hypothetical protein